ncbi:MAG: GH25 family lysozyme [Acidobacteriota bacterium]
MKWFSWLAIVALGVLMSMPAVAQPGRPPGPPLRVEAHPPFRSGPPRPPTVRFPDRFPPAFPPLVDHGGKPEGLDVSHFQHEIDWRAVRSSRAVFVYVKATEGVDLPDELFAENWRGAGEVGLLRGAYHVFQPLDDGAAQARFFLEVAKPRSGDLLPMLDVEVRKDVDAATLLARVQAWLDTVEEALGVKPVVYTNPRFWNALGGASFDAYPLWVAEYGVPAPVVPTAWSRWTLWQHTRQGRVPGVVKPVDLDRFNGSFEELRRAVIP